MSQGVDRCTGRNLPRDQVDALVLAALADKVFTPGRVEIMLNELQNRLKARRSEEDTELLALRKELNEVSLAQERLYEAVEKGLLPADDTLRVPAHKVQARRQEILVEVARKRDRGQIALAKLSPKQITCCCRLKIDQ